MDDKNLILKKNKKNPFYSFYPGLIMRARTYPHSAWCATHSISSGTLLHIFLLIHIYIFFFLVVLVDVPALRSSQSV